MKDNIRRRTTRFMAESGRAVAELESKLMARLRQKESYLKAEKSKLVEQIEGRFEQLIGWVYAHKAKVLSDLDNEFAGNSEELGLVESRLERAKELLDEGKRKGESVAMQLKNEREMRTLLEFFDRKNSEISDHKANVRIEPKVKITGKVPGRRPRMGHSILCFVRRKRVHRSRVEAKNDDFYRMLAQKGGKPDGIARQRNGRSASRHIFPFAD